MSEYVRLLLLLGVAGGVAAAMVALSLLLGKGKAVRGKFDPFECGSRSPGIATGRFPVKFYLVALLFILFDIEGVFFFPWAVLYRKLGWVGFVEMAVFAGILALGLVYIWKRGALEWD